MNAVIQTFGGGDQSFWAVFAAYLQAVLSAAAIFAAVKISQWDRQERERRESQRIVSALAAVFGRGEEVLRDSYLAMRDEGGEGFIRVFTTEKKASRDRTIAQCRKIIGETPALSLGDWELVSALLDMEVALEKGEAALGVIERDNRALRLYPYMAAIDLLDLRAAVNLAAEAQARVHQRAHQLAGLKRAKISPATVE